MKEETTRQNQFDYRTIKSFEDACKKESVDPNLLPDVTLIPEEMRKHVIAYYKLLIIYKAINNGWKPDWSNYNEYKYYPWFKVLSSGFGFSGSHCYCGLAVASVGSRLCTHTREMALYIADQFKQEYQDLFLYSE